MFKMNPQEKSAKIKACIFGIRDAIDMKRIANEAYDKKIYQLGVQIVMIQEKKE